MEFDFDAIEEEDSPFPEVRASVSNIDDPDMPALTIRMWFVGLFLCIISSSLNVFFNFRSPAPYVVPLALLLIAYPFGKFLAYILPITTYRFRSLEFSLNPGPWNIKEHVLVFIMANVAVGNPYALNAVVVAEFFYDIKVCLPLRFRLQLVRPYFGCDTSLRQGTIFNSPRTGKVSASLTHVPRSDTGSPSCSSSPLNSQALVSRECVAASSSGPPVWCGRRTSSPAHCSTPSTLRTTRAPAA
jgi:hypothetical protein